MRSVARARYARSGDSYISPVRFVGDGSDD
jgi:hypothetical protein